MDFKKIVKKLTLYKSDLYTGNIVIVSQTGEFHLNVPKDGFIQTDATCWQKDEDGIIYKNYSYILVRSFNENINIQNEIYYDIDSLIDLGLTPEDLFPIYPNASILNYYLNYCDMSIKTKNKCINYAKSLNKNFYK